MEIGSIQYFCFISFKLKPYVRKEWLMPSQRIEGGKEEGQTK